MDMENTEPHNSETTDVEPVGPTRSDRRWAMACHLIALTGLLAPPIIVSVVATLVLWLIKREDSALIDDQGRESLNFQITIFIYSIAAVLMIPLMGLGILLLVAVVVFDFTFVLVAAVKASEGIAYRYPACIRLIK
jgi:uncharacterized Tic20 family protein